MHRRPQGYTNSLYFWRKIVLKYIFRKINLNILKLHHYHSYDHKLKMLYSCFTRTYPKRIDRQNDVPVLYHQRPALSTLTTNMNKYSISPIHAFPSTSSYQLSAPAVQSYQMTLNFAKQPVLSFNGILPGQNDQFTNKLDILDGQVLQETFC